MGIKIPLSVQEIIEKKKGKRKKRKMQMRKVTEKFNGENITSILFPKTRLTEERFCFEILRDLIQEIL